jgi:hypothetical protein
LPAPNARPPGLLDALANLPSGNPAAFPSFQPTAFASSDGGQSAPPSLFSSLANLPWSPTSGEIGGVSDNDTVGNDSAGQFPSLDGVPFGAQRFDAPPGFAPAQLYSGPASSAASPLLQPVGPISGGSDQFAQQLQDQPASSSGSTDVGDNPGDSPSGASTTEWNDSQSVTRLVRDPAGRPLAIIHVQPAPSNTPTSESDATPDALRPGTKYTQINNAVTGNPVIDRTTDMLLAVLQESVLAMGPGAGARFGTAVHVDFANRVRKLDLPGIGQDGVEQGFRLDLNDFIRYGLQGSIRTDVTLRDPKDPNQRPIAVYDLKTGNAVLTPGRVKEIFDNVNTPGLLIIELQYRTGNAIDRTRNLPPR